MGESVLILGSTGFIGRALQDHLAREGTDSRGCASDELDLCLRGSAGRLAQALDSETTLVIAAARLPPAGAAVGGFAENVRMIETLARALETASLRRCVYFSSDSVYSWGTETVTEEAPVDPLGYYAIAKYLGECVLRTVADSRGFPLLVLRPVAVWGPGDTHGTYGPSRFVRSVAANRRVELFGEGEDLRDHIYIDDLVGLTSALLEREVDGVFNLATGTSRSFASIVEDLRSVVPFEFEVVNVSRSVPLRHRSFEIDRLLSVVPDFRFTSFTEALRTTYAAL